MWLYLAVGSDGVDMTEPEPAGGVDVGEIHRVASGVGGSFTKWQRKPPAHRVYMIPLGDRYESNEWCTVEVHHEHGEIVRMTDGAMGPKQTPFAHDLDMRELHPLDYAAVMRMIESDLSGGDRDE